MQISCRRIESSWDCYSVTFQKIHNKCYPEHCARKRRENIRYVHSNRTGKAKANVDCGQLLNGGIRKLKHKITFDAHSII